MEELRINNVAPEDVERFKAEWEALIHTHNRTVPIIAIPTLQWQRTFPTQDGFYWFYGENWSPNPSDAEDFDLPLQPPTIAYVVDSRRFCYTAQGIWYDKSAFPGYCAGPLPHPPTPAC